MARFWTKEKRDAFRLHLEEQDRAVRTEEGIIALLVFAEVMGHPIVFRKAQLLALRKK